LGRFILRVDLDSPGAESARLSVGLLDHDQKAKNGYLNVAGLEFGETAGLNRMPKEA